MTLREKISEAAFWHEHICLKCGCSDEVKNFVEATCDCLEGEELIVDAKEFQGVLVVLDQEGER